MARNSLLCADMPLRNYSLPPPVKVVQWMGEDLWLEVFIFI